MEQIKVRIKTMIYNPFAVIPGRMIEYGKNVLEAAIRENVKRIVMISRYIKLFRLYIFILIYFN